MGINSVKCSLGGADGVIPKAPETPANVSTLVHDSINFANGAMTAFQFLFLNTFSVRKE